MNEYWLTIDRVGFHRVFATGRIPEDEDFERELTPEQIRMVDAFLNTQQIEFQKFLAGVLF